MKATLQLAFAPHQAQSPSPKTGTEAVGLLPPEAQTAQNPHNLQNPNNSHNPQNPHKRHPLESLSSFVNSLEIKALDSKLSHSALSLRRSISHRLADLPLFPTDETSDEFDDENDTILNDEDWTASPSLKKKGCLSKKHKNSPGEIDTHQQIFASNEHLPKTSIHTFTVAQDNLPRIDEDELRKILGGEYEGQFDEFVVVDCRFPYEYEGGHILQAINIPLPQLLEQTFFQGENTPNMPQNSSIHRKLLIFHCEYSLLRGPRLATHLRKTDRQINAQWYPYLHYPDIVVLDRGYKGFFDKFMHFCHPQTYVAMKDDSHKRTCEIEMNKVMQTSKLTRAKSFTQFPPRLNLAHCRLKSLTALRTNQETTNTPANDAKLLRSKRSLKIKKRERKEPRPQFTQPLPGFLHTAHAVHNAPHAQNACESPQVDSPVCTRFEHEDFTPPTALFRNHSKSSSGTLFLSLNSSLLLLICSELLSPTFSFTFSESPLESVSLFNDLWKSDYYMSAGTDEMTENDDSNPALVFKVHPSILPEPTNAPRSPSPSCGGCNTGSTNGTLQKILRSNWTRANLPSSLRQEDSFPVFTSAVSTDDPLDVPVDYFLQPKDSQKVCLAHLQHQSSMNSEGTRE